MDNIIDTGLVRIIVSERTDPYYNLALEQLLTEKKPHGQFLIMLWRNDRTVVIGRYQNTYDEVDIPYACEHGIDIVRRDSGGGAVYHDLGNINYSFIVDRDSDAERTERSIRNALDNVLTRLGVSYEFDGRNDITVGGAKVSGSARHIRGGVLLHHGTMLVSSDLDVLRRVLTRSGKISGSSAAKSAPRRVGNLSELCGGTVDGVMDAFLGLDPDGLTDKGAYCGEDEINALAEEKYRSRQWNFGYQPAYDYSAGKRFPAGTVRIDAQIESGIIRSVRFSGDFFAESDIAALERALEGTPVNSSLADAIRSLGGDGCITGIRSEDIAGLFDEII